MAFYSINSNNPRLTLIVQLGNEILKVGEIPPHIRNWYLILLWFSFLILILTISFLILSLANGQWRHNLDLDKSVYDSWKKERSKEITWSNKGTKGWLNGTTWSNQFPFLRLDYPNHGYQAPFSLHSITKKINTNFEFITTGQSKTVTLWKEFPGVIERLCYYQLQTDCNSKQFNCFMALFHYL